MVPILNILTTKLFHPIWTFFTGSQKYFEVVVCYYEWVMARVFQGF